MVGVRYPKKTQNLTNFGLVSRENKSLQAKKQKVVSSVITAQLNSFYVIYFGRGVPEIHCPLFLQIP
jgi:hypothetical protein